MVLSPGGGGDVLRVEISRKKVLVSGVGESMGISPEVVLSFEIVGISLEVVLSFGAVESVGVWLEVVLFSGGD
jgi:hypothetical protein